MISNRRFIGIIVSLPLLLFSLSIIYASEPYCALTQAKERGKLIFGVRYDSYLFGYKDPHTEEIQGFEIDLANVITKELLGDGTKVEFKEAVPSNRLALLDNKEVDAIIGTMTITEERKKLVEFSDVYFMAGQTLLVPEHSSVKTIQDLIGKTVIAIRGSLGAANIRLKVPNVQVVEAQNLQEGFIALKEQKGLALTTDNSILSGLRKQNPGFKLTGGLFSLEPYGIAVRKGDIGTVTAINTVLRKLKSSQKYNRIYNKWFEEKDDSNKQ